MRKVGITLASVAAASFSLAGAALFTPIHQACAQQGQVSFAEDIVPIFKGWCVSCHQPGGQGYDASGLDLTSYDSVMKGTKFGPMVLPGHPDESNLVVLIEGRARIQMPFSHKALPDCLRSNIWTWIFQGAKNN